MGPRPDGSFHPIFSRKESKMPPIGKQPGERASYNAPDPGTDNYQPGGFTGGTTPSETSSADSFAGAVRPPWSKGFGEGTQKPYDGYTDTAHVGVGTIGPTPSTTFKG
jgi:hypothetical protein